MDYIIAGKVINISDERRNYNQVKKNYDLYVAYLLEEFRTIYTGENKNLDDVYYNINTQGKGLIRELTDITVDLLNEKYPGRFIKEDFYENYKKTDAYGSWSGEVENFKEKILKIESEGDKEEVEEEGILKDALNIIEDGLSKGKTFFKKGQIFKDPKTFQTFKSALENALYGLRTEYMYIVRTQEGRDVFQGPNQEDSEKADRLFRSLESDHMDREELGPVFNEIIGLNPYKEDYYFRMYDLIKDRDGELERLAKYFSVDILPYKLDDLRNLYDSYRFEIMKDREIVPKKEGIVSNLFHDEEDLRYRGFIFKPLRIELIEILRLYLIKISLLKYCDEIGLPEDNSIVEDLEDKIELMRDKFKNVNGIRYKTIRGSVKAKLERESILSLIEATDPGSIVELKETIDLIDLGGETDIKLSYLEDLGEKLDGLIDREIGDLIDKSNTDSIEAIEELKGKIEENYEEAHRDKHIKNLNYKISYIKTKGKVNEGYKKISSKIKDGLNKLFK